MRNNILFSAGLIVSALIAFSASPSYAIEKLFSPNVVKGEAALEYNGSATVDGDHSKNGIQSHELAVEYTLTDRFLLEINTSFDKQPDESVKFNTIGFNGRYMLFEPGENWLDSGIMLGYGHATHLADTDAIEAKLLLQKTTGAFVHTANIGLEQEVGSHHSGGPDRVILWNSRYRYNDYFEPGIEIQSDFGKPNEHLGFNGQEHYIGPSVYGELGHHLQYEAAYLFGASDAASDGAVRVLLEYEMHF